MEKNLTQPLADTRRSGLDILRIISMCWIIGLHILLFCGVLEGAEKQYGGARCSLVWSLEILMRSSVNIFGILSGFLYGARPKEKFRSSSVISLILTAIFYSAVISAVFFFAFHDTYASLSIIDKIGALFPALKGHYWYITCYVFLFFIIPYINVALQNLTKKSFQKLLLVLFILLCIIPTFGIKDFFRTEYGYSPLWLAYCYLIGAYLRLHPLEASKWMRKSRMLAAVVINTVVMLLSKYAIHFLTAKILGEPKGENALLQYVSPLMVFNALLIFCIFKDITVKNKTLSSCLALFSKAAFGAYIIHCHFLLNEHIWPGSFGFLLTHNPFLVVFETIGLSAAVFIVCASIDILRGYMFKFLRIDKFCGFIGKCVDKIWI